MGMTNIIQTKQVIVIRKDLKMRRGKEIAQGCHASMAFITKQLAHLYLPFMLTEPEQHWLQNSFRKICLQVNSEAELLEIHKIAQDKGITSHLVCDAGLTEFEGPTNTCVAIGPDYDERIDEITSHLKLY